MFRATIFNFYKVEEWDPHRPGVPTPREVDRIHRQSVEDYNKPPKAIIQWENLEDVEPDLDMLRNAFGLPHLMVDYDAEELEPGHPLLDQGGAMLRHARAVLIEGGER